MLRVFDICDICPSLLPRSDIILLKNAARYKVESKRQNDPLSKFSSKVYKYSRIL
jgi:hypothetical protein